MSGRQRVRRFAKWISLGTCILILWAWATSVRTAYSYSLRNQKSAARIDFGYGQIRLVFFKPPLPQSTLERLPDGFESRSLRSSSPVTGAPVPLSNLVGLHLPGVVNNPSLIRCHIPLWLPWSILFVSTTVLFAQDRQSARFFHRSGRSVAVRWSRPACLAIGATCFLALLMVLASILEALYLIIWGDDCFRINPYHRNQSALKWLASLASICLILLLPCLGARYVYTILRWRPAEGEAAHCRTCGYDLTDNETGVCPECGTNIGRAE